MLRGSRGRETLSRRAVRGTGDSEGTIELSLSKISSAEKGWRMIAAKKGKPSITHWRVLHEIDGRACSNSAPRRGGRTRSASIAQAGLGMPLLGDPVYGNGKRARRAPCCMPLRSRPARRQAADRCHCAAATRFRRAGVCGRSRLNGYASPTRARHRRREVHRLFGPGGQNVNKVATAVQLRVNVFGWGCRPKRSSD